MNPKFDRSIAVKFREQHPQPEQLEFDQLTGSINAAFKNLAAVTPTTSDDLIFRQAGIGVIARTAQNKLREIEVSVTDFAGIDPTGVADSAAAIQAAVNSIQASDSLTATTFRGGRIKFPPGIYRVASPIVVTGAALEFVGPSWGDLERVGVPATSHHPTATILIDIPNSGTVAGFQLLSSDTWITRRIQFTNLGFLSKNAWNTGVQINSSPSVNPIDGVGFKNCVFLGGTYGIHVTGSNPIFELRVDNCSFFQSENPHTLMQVGIYSDIGPNPGISTIIRDTTFRNLALHAAWIHKGPPGNVIFDNCTFENIGGPSLRWEGPGGQLHLRSCHWESCEQTATWTGTLLQSAVTGQRACLIWIDQGIDHLEMIGPDAQLIWYGDSNPRAAASMGLIGVSSAYNNGVSITVLGGYLQPKTAMGQPYINVDRSGAVLNQVTLLDTVVLDLTTPSGALIAGTGVATTRQLLRPFGVTSQPSLALTGSYGLRVDAGGSSADYNSLWRSLLGTELMRLLGDGTFGLGTPTPNLSGAYTPATQQIMTLRGSSDQSTVELATGVGDSASASAGHLAFVAPANTGGAVEKRIAFIAGDLSGATANQRGGSLSFYTKKNASGSFNVSTMDNAGAWTFPAKIASYNGATTAGIGAVIPYGYGRVLAQTATVASVATYTPTADGSFWISCNLNITALTVGTVTPTCTYTDETNTPRTASLTVSSLGGTLGLVAGATGPFEGLPLHIRVKANTAITIVATVSAAATLTFNAEGVITQFAA